MIPIFSGFEEEGPALERSSAKEGPAIARFEDYFRCAFQAMASPCEVLVDTDDPDEASRALAIAEAEAKRIEAKFSRYRPDSIVSAINHAGGRETVVDEETGRLLDYADTCYELSDGLFDITSGALRRVWRFDGGDQVPSRDAVEDVLRFVGWQKVSWKARLLRMPAGMEIDLGGIGKEYAVDRAAALIMAGIARPFLVNFGGDLFANAPRRSGRPWGVGVDDPSRTGESVLYEVLLTRGGLATSGDARRFVMKNGQRLGHILNAKTGWPVEDAPRSVTVIDRTCLEAGTISTLAILHGPRAREFLEAQGVEFQIV